MALSDAILSIGARSAFFSGSDWLVMLMTAVKEAVGVDGARDSGGAALIFVLIDEGGMRT